MKSLVGRFFGNGIVQNTIALYAVQFSRKVIPLITFPYLAITLGPDGWGVVAFVQSLGDFVVLLVGFGFSLSATREVARRRDSPTECSEIMAGVLGAQFALSLIGITGALLIAYSVPLLRQNPKLLLAGLFYALAQSFNPLWFLAGLEKMRLSATLEISGKVLALCGIFLLVHSPADNWKVLALQGVPACLSSVIGLWFVYRMIPLRFPSLILVREALQRGWSMFLLRSGQSLYEIGNTFVLGLFAPVSLVGYFAGAEKISKAIFGLLNPIGGVLYPRLSNLIYQSRDKAIRLARIGAILMIGGGLLLGLLVYVFAPLLIESLLGPGFEPAVTVLRVLSLGLPLAGLRSSVAYQWLLPLGREAIVNRIIMFAGLLNISLALVLAPKFAHVGMAWTVVCTELFICASLVWVVTGSTPLWNGSVRPTKISQLPN